MIRHALCFLLLMVLHASAADRSLNQNPELARYFDDEVARIEQQNSLLYYTSLEQWEADRPRLRAQLFDMLGLNPLPGRTSLNATVTGVVEETEFRVEKLHFQSMPGLYVTANFYLPKDIDVPLPTVLYVCGHAGAKEGSISFGNKTSYHHHGVWFARNGYACLTIDTIQLGEIEGVHHGTYSHNRWWWNARGYSPAGVEAWNCIRALDYLETRPEVDADRFGVTGRSGGGAYSWWLAALDERIRCAVPVAGICSLRNHVVDGCVEGHCDCMYFVNTNRWDFARVAALVAPRPLLISNTDKDSIFPLDGVVDVHRQVRHIYDLYEKPRQLGLHITEGPHQDTQELRVHAFRWINRWLRNDESLLQQPAAKSFSPSQLRVLTNMPADERVTCVDEFFVPPAVEPDDERLESIQDNPQEWADDLRNILRTKSFAAWPADTSLEERRNDRQLRPLQLSARIQTGQPDISGFRLPFDSQPHVPLFVDVILPPGEALNSANITNALPPLHSLQLFVLNGDDWDHYQRQFLADHPDESAAPIGVVERMRQQLNDGNPIAVFVPRGSGPHAWVGDEKKQIQIRRRFQLIGTTADAMRVWDVRKAIHHLRSHRATPQEITIDGTGHAGWLALTALVFGDSGLKGQFSDLSASRDAFPVFLNAARFVTPQELIGLAATRCRLRLDNPEPVLSEFAGRLTRDNRWTGREIFTD